MKLVPLSSGHDRNNSGVQFQNALLARGKDRQPRAPFEHLNELIAHKTLLRQTAIRETFDTIVRAFFPTRSVLIYRGGVSKVARVKVSM